MTATGRITGCGLPAAIVHLDSAGLLVAWYLLLQSALAYKAALTDLRSGLRATGNGFAPLATQRHI